MSNVPHQPGDEVFDNPHSAVGQSTYLLLGGVGLILLAAVAFVLAIIIPRGQLWLHTTTTLPTIIATGMLARGFSLRSLPTRVVVSPSQLEISTNQGTKSYPWSEIGSAMAVNALNSHTMLLRVTDTHGNTIARIDESFPGYQRLLKLVESYVDSKPDDTARRIAASKARRFGLLAATMGCFMAAGGVFMAFQTWHAQRAQELLAQKSAVGEGEIVRRFVAPDGLTKRLEFGVAGSSVKNVKVSEVVWNQLEDAKTVPVIYAPDEPDISRLEAGEIQDDDFEATPMKNYLVSAGCCLMGLLFIGYSPIAWMGYDLAFDD